MEHATLDAPLTNVDAPVVGDDLQSFYDYLAHLALTDPVQASGPTPPPPAPPLKRPGPRLADRWGPLDRAPLPPKNRGAAVLRRTLETYRRWAVQIAECEQQLKADPGLRTAQTKLNVLRAKSALTQRRALLLRDCLKARLAQTKDPKHGRLVAIVEDVLDTAHVQAKTAEASDALQRIVTRVAPRMNKLLNARARYSSHQEGWENALDSAVAARDEGIWHGAKTWDHNHPSQASLTTRCYMLVLRNLQVRTRIDRAIGTRKSKDGKWFGAASTISVEIEGDTYEPHGTLSAQRVPVSPLGEAHAQDHARAVANDVHRALELLDPLDAKIARAMMLEGYTARETAKLLGISVNKVRTRHKEIEDFLYHQLTAYERPAPVEPGLPG